MRRKRGLLGGRVLLRTERVKICRWDGWMGVEEDGWSEVVPVGLLFDGVIALRSD